MKAKSRIWLGVLTLCVVLAGFRLASVSPLPPAAYYSGNLPYVIAHQGGNGLRPGNTIVAFNKAMELGVDVLEMDVHASVDGQLVLIHDTTVERTTNGSGDVSSLTLVELKALDAAYHWPFNRSDSRPFRNSGVQIPLLSEVLQSFPDKRYVIEIKQFQPSIVQELCNMLTQFQVLDRTMVASTDGDTIRNFRQRCPRVATSSYSNEIAWFLAFHHTGLLAMYQAVSNAFQVPTHFGSYQLIDKSFVDGARSAGLHIEAWTINDVKTMQVMLDAGVSGVITDYPDKLLELMEKIREGE